MTTNNLPPLPSEQQCLSLTDDQCRAIQQYQDPEGSRINADWEVAYQPELLRHYMRRLSFKQIEDVMKPRLEWCYKTYQNRYKDWRFPLNQMRRESVIRDLFDRIRSQEGYMEWSTANTIQSNSRTQTIQPHPNAPLSVPSDFFFSASQQAEVHPPRPDTRMSYASGTTQSSYYDDTFSSHRASILTTNSSISSGSLYSLPIRDSSVYSLPIREPVQPRQPKHDPNTGIWNGVLRVIPCRINHSSVSWTIPSNPCQAVGFDTFVAAMTVLRDVPKVDFAGNFPIHYLMSAGVGVEFFSILTQWMELSPRNFFDQNPLHVLNPLGLEDQLISLLGWLRGHGEPPAFLSQRDIYCRTPLQALLLWPLEKSLYLQILAIFPGAEQQLRALDNTGSNIVTRMQQASMKIKAASPAEFAKIQTGITEIKLYLSADGRTPNRNHQYGFHDIARGARGLTVFGYFQCKICNGINTHTNSYWDQICCAVEHNRDRYEPDDTGMTPAHALVTVLRCSMDADGNAIPETADETAQLFKFLVPRDDPRLHEVLHALDPEGNSLIYNIATRGLDEILEYVLLLEDVHRRRAMVNFCTRIPNHIRSVLDAVHLKAQEVQHGINHTSSKHVTEKRALEEHRRRLIRCKSLLCHSGAVSRPVVTMRFGISSN